MSTAAGCAPRQFRRMPRGASTASLVDGWRMQSRSSCLGQRRARALDARVPRAGDASRSLDRRARGICPARCFAPLPPPRWRVGRDRLDWCWTPPSTRAAATRSRVRRERAMRCCSRLSPPLSRSSCWRPPSRPTSSLFRRRHLPRWSCWRRCRGRGRPSETRPLWRQSSHPSGSGAALTRHDWPGRWR